MSNVIFHKISVVLLSLVLINTSRNVSSKNLDNRTEETTLELVAILHRHGLRTPERTWRKDPFANEEKYWPIGWGQLLPKGKQQLYELGKTFRERYSDFITEYAANTVRVNSSDIDRCHMSAASLLAGWFPPENGQIWNKDLLWQPIPIHSVPSSEDRILALKAPCPRRDLEKAKVDKELQANETAADKKLFKYLTKYMGEKINSIHQMSTYYSTLTIEKLHGYRLQSWTKSVFPHKMKVKHILSLKSDTWTDYLKRILGGPMVKELLQQFKNKIEGVNKHNKLYLYSAHDTTLTNVWRAFQFTQDITADFGSALIFELHKAQDDFLVKMLFMNDTTKTEPYELSIPNCQSPCKFATLYSVTEYVRAVDWDKDCVV